MRIVISLIACLSLFGCIDNPKLPPRPDGLSCTHYFGVFICDSINDLNAPQKEFDVNAPEMEKAQCMPFETFERYSKYVQELKDLADRNCRL